MARNMEILCERHLPQVLEIEAVAFEKPWSVDRWLDLSRRGAAVVMQSAEAVLGYVVFEYVRVEHQPLCPGGRPSRADYLEVFRLATHVDYRLQHVGLDLLRHVLGKMEIGHLQAVHAVVPEINTPAQLLCRKAGMRCDILVKGDVCGQPATDYHFVAHRMPRVGCAGR